MWKLSKQSLSHSNCSTHTGFLLHAIYLESLFVFWVGGLRLQSGHTDGDGAEQISARRRSHSKSADVNYSAVLRPCFLPSYALRVIYFLKQTECRKAHPRDHCKFSRVYNGKGEIPLWVSEVKKRMFTHLDLQVDKHFSASLTQVWEPVSRPPCWTVFLGGESLHPPTSAEVTFREWGGKVKGSLLDF